MTTKTENDFSRERFMEDVRFVLGMLATDVQHAEKLIETAKENAPDLGLEFRRELRPLAVELLYSVIGTPKTFEEALDEASDEENEDGK